MRLTNKQLEETLKRLSDIVGLDFENNSKVFCEKLAFELFSKFHITQLQNLDPDLINDIQNFQDFLKHNK